MVCAFHPAANTSECPRRETVEGVSDRYFNACIEEKMSAFGSTPMPRGSSSTRLEPIRLQRILYPSVFLWTDRVHETLHRALIPGTGVWDHLLHRQWPFGKYMRVRVALRLEYNRNCPARDRTIGAGLRYAWFCEGDHGTDGDPPNVDHRITQLIYYFHTDMAMRSLTVSGSIRVPIREGAKMELYSSDICAHDELPQVRYTIFESVVTDSNSFLQRRPREKLPFRWATEIGLQLMRLVRRLHSLSIVHADTRLAKVVFRNTLPRTLALQMFQHAIRLDAYAISRNRPP